ncbi:rhamnosyl/mannosyltransferase [Pseudomonas duriflava]|uniref:Rhamnosyl/mannosyltransferase n=1 Tax=Pseudomonas duriflava TaxID=459528 RepID=A0A562QJX5_9PSED|nr:glycosyltransferase family 4 protein [Pseudomonas duriflava]TWI56490.1 rhamnosyl/mannosyltransferase [Pseudomonas duriflava]
MKVLHFFKTYRPQTFGGIEQVIYQLAEGGIAYGIESEVLYLSSQGSGRAEPSGRHISHRSKLDFHVASTGFSLSAFKDFAELAAQADLVHYHFPWPYMDLAHYVSRIRKPTVVSYHSDIVKQKWLLKLYQPLMHQFLGAVDSIVASSPVYAAFSPVLRRYRDKVTVIPYGLDRAIYPQPTQERLAYWQRQLKGPFFLFIGALRYYKGLHFLLQALRGQAFTCVIAGHGFEEAALKQQAEQLGLSNVLFTGLLSEEDKAALLTLCYAFVFPSHLRSEAFGISLLEAAMYGKPMISCEIHTGTSFINLDQETGLVIPPADPVALTEAMKTLLGDPERAARMGEKAIVRYESVFSSEQMLQSYAELYRTVLVKRRAL